MHAEPMKMPDLSKVNRGVRILLVEDDDLDARLVETELAKDRRVEKVVRARNGAEAEAAVTDAAELPDLIITDLSMPGKDGIAFLKSFRELESERQMDVALTNRMSPIDGRQAFAPIVVMTGSDRAADFLKVVESKGNTFVTKPSTPEELRLVLRKIVRSVIWSEPLPSLLSLDDEAHGATGVSDNQPAQG